MERRQATISLNWLGVFNFLPVGWERANFNSP